MIAHEEAVLAVHPLAREFRPVRAGLRGHQLLGWIFEMPRKEGAASLWYGWVTSDVQVSQDRLEDPRQAAKNLRAYIRSQPSRPPYKPAEGIAGEVK